MNVGNELWTCMGVLVWGKLGSGVADLTKARFGLPPEEAELSAEKSPLLGSQ